MISASIDSILRGARLQTSSNDSSYRNFVDRLVLPGMILELSGASDGPVSWSVGPGLVCVPTSRMKSGVGKNKLVDSVLVRQFGILKFKSKIIENSDSTDTIKRLKLGNSSVDMKSENVIWLECLVSTGAVTTLLPLSRLSYRCHVGQFQPEDKVIGIVLKKAGELFVVDIGCASPATLNYLSFEGSSKKNRPDIHAGDVLYAMITRADRDLEIELSCVDETGKACGMGILGRHEPGTVGNAGGRPGGVLLYCTQDLIRRLGNQDEFPLLKLLSKVYPFEIFFGANGRIWLTSGSTRETMILANAIAISEHIPASECCKLAKELC
uniref:Ribosomal RNA-processing protein 40 n=1 Tax=Schistosoma japonicum TaxID=6182 RepID=Q5D9C6_SCHJA|nr:SJCHGC05501 protein [Schistosoma japonicum]